MTDNTQADEYLQEQLVEQGDMSSMRYIGDDYTRIVTIREDKLLDIITAYTDKQVEQVLDMLYTEVLSSDYIGISAAIRAERGKVSSSKYSNNSKIGER